MTTVPDIPIVQLPALETDEALAEAPASIWAVDVSSGRRPSSLTLAVLGVLAGIAAMALGAAAVVSAGTSADASADASVGPTTTPSAASSLPTVERRVLALLAKPSTERVAFRGAPGLVLVVGSGGRAAILFRGVEHAAAGKPYVAWILAPDSAPVRAARFVGTESAVFLTRQLGPRASVAISASRPIAGPPTRNRIVAVRS